MPDDEVQFDPEYEARVDQVYSSLSPDEERWRDRQRFLQSMGYMLRPRFRPGWVPSWRGKMPAIRPEYSEDGISLPLREHLIDATRISDGKLVYIKRVKTGDKESQIVIMLSSVTLRDHPRNHCVPILDTFQDNEDPSISYIVMPFLNLFDRPPLERVSDVVDLVDQLLEGLQFLHEQGVAHRDCAAKNLMMDASALYPLGFHPVTQHFLPDAVTPVYPLPRHSVKVKYYYVDFGISSHFTPDRRGDRLVLGRDGRDREVPELSNITPYDPFKVDIFIIGNLFRREFHDKFNNVEFLASMIAAMTQVDPARRPSAQEASRLWQRQRTRVSDFFGQWPLKKRSDTFIVHLYTDICALCSAVSSYTESVLRWATGSRR